jgi:hypothetical protein
VDQDGKPLVGWLIYLYVQNSSTPFDSYQDTALTVKNPWPVQADANGMIPQFWLADGSYRVRATTADGSLTLFDIPSVLALGPSTGAAPSGGVDATAIFATGDVIWLDVAGGRTGWVRDNGRTIGSATSGGTERANADCQALFQFLWNTFSNAICPVSGGRGGSSLADWNSNKQITLPDKRGYIAGGLDDMGNSAAGRWAGAPIIAGTVTTPGATLGEITHVVTQAELPAVNFAHSGTTLNDPGHHHSQVGINNQSGVGPGSGAASGATTNTGDSTTGITISNQGSAASGGSNAAHNNAQRTVLGTFYRKL